MKRLKIIEETRIAKETAKKARKGFARSLVKKIQIYYYNDYSARTHKQIIISLFSILYKENLFIVLEPHNARFIF